jgi:hypothetical protein
MPRGGSKPGERRGGRKPGSRNKATAGIREIARSFIDDPDYRAALKVRIANGTAGPIETLMWHYAHGRPLVDASGDGQIPVAITIHF